MQRKPQTHPVSPDHQNFIPKRRRHLIKFAGRHFHPVHVQIKMYAVKGFIIFYYASDFSVGLALNRDKSTAKRGGLITCGGIAQIK